MAKTGHPNFALKYTSPWRGKQHQWSVTSSHSGASFGAEADQISFLQSVHAVIASFIASGSSTYCSGWDYYNGQDKAALASAIYATGAAANTAGFGGSRYGNAYGGSTVGYSGLETCVLLYAPVGLSTTGKPVSLKKFIHSVPAGNGNDAPPLVAADANPLAAQLGDGSLFGNRVLISASGKQGAWVVDQFFSNHQMPRKRKKKVSGNVAASNLLVQALDNAASVALKAARDL